MTSVPPTDAHLLARARAWLAEDPDEETRAELQALVEAGDLDALGERFAGTLEFGTAGLRGELGAGPTRMNRVVVLRAAAGLAAYLRDTGARGPVVIGYDARHNSDVFARDTAEVMTGAGFEALVMPRPLPTPVLAFAIRDLGACAGVMVTASHNPPRDNGYKVYLGDGSQIVAPTDSTISARIAGVGPLASIPRGDAGTVLGNELVDRYLDAVTGLLGDGPRALTTVYTPLHGVGGDLVVQAMQFAGFPDPTVERAQRLPDPDFPTVAFPNPEEPGALDLAIALAARKKADLVLANDPDADRCAAAVPTPDGWRILRGDEVGALLAHHLLAKGRKGTYAASIVSSSLVGRLAAAAGMPYVETLTGFKWISRVEGLAFGYEEALGYCVDPDHVRDKDGISALLLLCELAAARKAAGSSLTALLDEIAVEHGLHATDQVSVRVDDVALIDDAMRRLRDNPPATLGGAPVERVDDLALGQGGLPATEGLRYLLGPATGPETGPGSATAPETTTGPATGAGITARVIVRPSGTEPKLKCYLEVVVPVDGDVTAVPAARAVAAERLAALGADIRAALGL